MITIMYNGNNNLPTERNHRTRSGFMQMSREFTTLDEAIFFWLECEFYSGAITSLDELLPNGTTHPLLECMNEAPLHLDEVLLPDQKLVYLTEREEWT